MFSSRSAFFGRRRQLALVVCICQVFAYPFQCAFRGCVYVQSMFWYIMGFRHVCVLCSCVFVGVCLCSCVLIYYKLHILFVCWCVCSLLVSISFQVCVCLIQCVQVGVCRWVYVCIFCILCPCIDILQVSSVYWYTTGVACVLIQRLLCIVPMYLYIAGGVCVLVYYRCRWCVDIASFVYCAYVFVYCRWRLCIVILQVAFVY